MSSVSNSLQGSQTGNSIDEAISQAINVSDASQMENNFITLMVAQIQNQDPTEPVDSTQFLNQYSAMSQVKSLENMTAMTQSNLVLLDNLQTLTAAGLVGQEVQVNTDQVVLGSSTVNGSTTLEHNAGELRVVLTDRSGNSRELSLGAQAPGKVAFSLNAADLGLAPGTYQLSIKSDSGEYPKANIAGRVSHVAVSSSGPVLDVEGAGSVPFYNITEFGQIASASLL
jgi:flagellar basal-body rod modification protein FlgD